jgi:ribosome biogenesis protein Nip4
MMMMMTTYRRPTREERTLINRALDRWGAFDFFQDKVILVGDSNKGSRQVCLVPKGIIIETAIVQRQPYFAGLVLGQLKKQFMPSMQGADLFARVGRRNEYYVTVNKNSEQLVLYGRDVMGDSIVEASDSRLGENEVVILLNAKQEAIGIGRTRFGGKSLLQKGKITVTTLADAGYYLREEG